jgi:hypothetical protein
VDLPIRNGGSFHSYVSLPEGMSKSDGQNMAKPKIQRLAVNVFPLFIPSFILSAGRADQSASYAFSKLHRDQETALTMEFSEMDIWKYAGGED